jgi:hypothetical protein
MPRSPRARDSGKGKVMFYERKERMDEEKGIWEKRNYEDNIV